MELPADTRARGSGHASAPADPGVLAAEGEICEAGRLAVAEGGSGRVEIVVERVFHEFELLLVDVERHDVALVRGVEQRGTLARRDRPRRADVESLRQSRSRTFPAFPSPQKGPRAVSATSRPTPPA